VSPAARFSPLGHCGAAPDITFTMLLTQVTADKRAKDAADALTKNVTAMGYTIDIAPAPTDIDPGFF
jgi:hypothetical protein